MVLSRLLPCKEVAHNCDHHSDFEDFVLSIQCFELIRRRCIYVKIDCSEDG